MADTIRKIIHAHSTTAGLASIDPDEGRLVFVTDDADYPVRIGDGSAWLKLAGDAAIGDARYYAEYSIDAAADSQVLAQTVTFLVTKNPLTFLVIVATGAGAYECELALPTVDTNGTTLRAGTTARVVVDFQTTSADRVINIRNASTGGTLLTKLQSTAGAQSGAWGDFFFTGVQWRSAGAAYQV